jgi:hypothetical protein
MRRLVAIAAFALLLAVPLWAQRGGGHGGGGHSGGFSGGHAGFSGGHVGGGGHAFGGMHSGSGVARGFSHGPSVGQRGFSGRQFSNRSFHQPFLHDGFHGRHFHNRFRNNCFGAGCGFAGYPWAYNGFYDPYWWGDSGSSYDDDYQQNLATAAEMNRQNLEEQRMLRQEEADGDRDAYSQQAQAPRAVKPGNTTNDDPPGAAIMPNTVLVYRDQHKEEVTNYAIVGNTLWNFSPGHTKKIPLSDLDVPATTKANQDIGVTFRVPGSNEGQ